MPLKVASCGCHHCNSSQAAFSLGCRDRIPGLLGTMNPTAENKFHRSQPFWNMVSRFLFSKKKVLYLSNFEAGKREIPQILLIPSSHLLYSRVLVFLMLIFTTAKCFWAPSLQAATLLDFSFWSNFLNHSAGLFALESKVQLAKRTQQ